MSTLDERVWQLRNGIIQRLNNPEGLQEEEVDALICAAQAEGAEQERERIRNANGVLRLENDDAHAVWVTAGEYFILPASLLSLAPKEKL